MKHTIPLCHALQLTSMSELFAHDSKCHKTTTHTDIASTLCLSLHLRAITVTLTLTGNYHCDHHCDLKYQVIINVTTALTVRRTTHCGIGGRSSHSAGYIKEILLLLIFFFFSIDKSGLHAYRLLPPPTSSPLS